MIRFRLCCATYSTGKFSGSGLFSTMFFISVKYFNINSWKKSFMRGFSLKRAALAVMLASAPLMGLAAAPAPSMADYLKAVNRMETLMKNAQGQSWAPRLGDPEVGPLLQTIADPSILPQMDAMDSLSQSNFCRLAVKIDVEYNLWGIGELKSQVPPDLETNPQAMREFSQKFNLVRMANNIAYQSELTLLGAFSARCAARMLPKFEQRIHSLKPEEWTASRLAGLHQLQMGNTTAIMGMLIQLNDPNTSPANRQLLLAALPDSVPALVSVIPVSERQQLVSLVTKIPAHTDEEKSTLAQIKTDLENTDCNLLCSH